MNTSNKNYYSSIDDIILDNYWKCQSGELKYCRKNLKVGNPTDDDEAWENIFDSYIDEFGLGPEYERMIELKREIALLQCELVIGDEMFVLNNIRRLESELKDMLENKSGVDRDGLVIHLEKWLGFRINEKEITARKYYKIIERFKAESEQIKKQNS